MLNQQMSDGLSHLQVCPVAALQPRLFLVYTLEECMSQHSSPVYILWGNYSNLFRPETSLRPETISTGNTLTQAFVPFSDIWYTVNPTAALHEVTPAGRTTMNVLFIGLALFGGKSG